MLQNENYVFVLKSVVLIIFPILLRIAFIWSLILFILGRRSKKPALNVHPIFTGGTQTKISSYGFSLLRKFFLAHSNNSEDKNEEKS